MKTPLLVLFSLACSSIAFSQDISELEESAQVFIEAFNEGNADSIAELFATGGELVLASGELISGREEIRSHYQAVFDSDTSTRAALEAGSVRFLNDSLAIEDGTVHLTSADRSISSHHYTAIHAKQEDGDWLLASLRDLSGDHALPSEKLMALEWLVGDWVIQTPTSDTWISFFWSESGPYIDAKAVTVAPTGPSTAATMRIGWNDRDETFQSWGFDAVGGFTQSKWAQNGEGEWLLRTEGVTAGGETNRATQVLAVDSSGQSFSWSKRDQTLGGVMQEDRTIKVVKRPPPPIAATEESE